MFHWGSTHLISPQAWFVFPKHVKSRQERNQGAAVSCTYAASLRRGLRAHEIMCVIMLAHYRQPRQIIKLKSEGGVQKVVLTRNG